MRHYAPDPGQGPDGTTREPVVDDVDAILPPVDPDSVFAGPDPNHPPILPPPVEAKVKAATWATFAGTLIVAILTGLTTNVPAVQQWLLSVGVAPNLVTLAVGAIAVLGQPALVYWKAWNASHTFRPDLGECTPEPAADPVVTATDR